MHTAVHDPNNSQSILSARNLTRIYGDRRGGLSHTALDSIDLSVMPGEFLGVMGPSGSGKSTLLNLLATIDRPTSGSVTIAGIDPAGMGPDQLALFRRRKLGFVFQDFNLLDTLSLKENILLPLVLDRMPAREMMQRLERISGILGIGAILDRKPFQVSGGQQQRAAIARAMIHEPELLLADELTGNLDSKAGQDVMDALDQLNREFGVTVVIVTHDPFAASYCKRVLFIRDGRTHSELRAGEKRQVFFQQILDSLSVLGAGNDDVR